MASQAISFKVLLAAKLLSGSRTLKAQIAANASVANANVANANILVLMRNFIIVLPRDVCIYSAMCWLSHTESCRRWTLFRVKCGVAWSPVGTAGIVAARGSRGLTRRMVYAVAEVTINPFVLAAASA